MNQDSLIIVVDSEKSRNVFPENNSCSFSNRLNSTVRFSEHEVALIKLFYHDKYVSEESLKKPLVEKTGKSFYDETKHQNTMYVNEVLLKETSIQKTYDALEHFMYVLNQRMVTGDVSASFKLDKDEQGNPLKVTFVYRYDFGNRIRLGQLAEILGFEDIEYAMGVYESSKLPNTTKFDEYTKDHSFVLQRRKWKMTRITLPQLQDPSLDDICFSITASAAEAGYRIAAIVDDEREELTINTFSQDIYLSLSGFLNNYLQLTFRHSFSGYSVVSVPKDIINPYVPAAATNFLEGSSTPAKHIPTKVLVQCGLSLTNYFESQPMQLLQIFSRTEGNGEILFDPPNPLYFPVTNFETSFVNIKMMDEHLSPLPVIDKPTTAVLHFRRKIW